MKPTERKPGKLGSGPEGAEPFDPVRVEGILFIAVPIRRFHLRLMIFLPFGEAEETKLRRLPLHPLALVLGRIGARGLILALMPPSP